MPPQLWEGPEMNQASMPNTAAPDSLTSRLRKMEWRTTAAHTDGSRWKYVKGAPEIVLSLCDAIAGGHTADEVRGALAEAQNVAEALYAADDPDALLESLNFSQSHGTWTRDDGSYSLYVSTTTTPTEAGELFQAEIRAFYLTRDAGAARPVSEEFFSLPCTRYKEAKS